MKTTISIPDALFDEADGAAKRLGLSRSELYVRALEAFLAKQRGAEITAALDAVYQEEASHADSALATLQYRAVGQDDDW